MRVLFFHPERHLNIGIPSGIATLAALLKRHGHEVDVFDTTLLKPRPDSTAHAISSIGAEKIIAAGDEVPHAVPNHTGIFKATSVTLEDLIADDPLVDYAEEFQKKINAFKPDLIALSAMTTTFDFACDLLEKVSSDAKVIIGGVHATIAPEDCLSRDAIDIVCIGEADRTFIELCNLMAAGKDYTTVNSMLIKMADGKVIRNKLEARYFDLNDLPTPEWSIFDDRQLFRPYDGQVYKGSMYSQSRGCPMQCTYCVDPTIAEITGGRSGYFRYQSPQTTYRQLKELRERYDATWFKFVDDTFLLPPIEHLEELRDLIKPLGIQFGCSVMPNTIKPEKVVLAREMGCVAMSIGVESGDPEMRKTVMRHYKNEDLIQRLKVVKDNGIRISTFNMIGFPGEHREQVFKTIDLNRELKAEACNVYILYPYPGSPIALEHNIPLRNEEGRIPDATGGSKLGLSHMGKDELEGLCETFNAYLHAPKSLWPVIRLAEKQDERGAHVFSMVQEYVGGYLNKENVELIKISDVVSETVLGEIGTPDLFFPRVFKPIFDLGYASETLKVIVSAFEEYARQGDMLPDDQATKNQDTEFQSAPSPETGLYEVGNISS